MVRVPRLVCGLLGCALLPSAPAAGQTTAEAGEVLQRPALESVRLAPGQRPRVDGVLSEAIWAEAPQATGFIQLEPEPGQPASERTEVMVLYDDAALYVGFRCFVRDPATLVARLARRDEFIISDRVYVDIDSHNDDRTGFSFSVSAGGVERDLLLYDDVESDGTWDAVWDGKTARFSGPDGAGYTVEMRIPFSQLRYHTGEGLEIWGIQFERDIPTAGETSFWAPVLPELDGYVSLFGQLNGLDVQRAPRQIEIVPYAAGRLIRASGDVEDPFYEPNATEPAYGFDAQIGLTSNLTLTATVNPDFGQVEADPAVVNLSAFETFFEERRPFFVEGVDIFEYGRTRTSNVSFRPTFFYSRRIGRSPTRFPGAAEFIDIRDQTTIAAAGKVSGKAGPWSIGLLNAVTLDETARFVDQEGIEFRTSVEPLSNYFVGRLQRDFNEGASVVGGIFTSVHRQMGTDSLFTDLLAEQAYLGGLDFEHRFANRQWTASGVVAGSAVLGDASRIHALQRAPQRYFQRPDQDYLSFDFSGRSLVGLYSEVSLAKTGGRHWRGSLTGNVATPGFEINDLGFQDRADVAALNWYLEYRQPQPSWLNYYSLYAFGGWGSNFGGDLIDHDYRAGAFLQFPNLWSWSTTVGINPERANDRLTRGGPLAVRPAYTVLSSAISTDRSRRLSANLLVSLLRDLPHDFNGTVPEWDRFITVGVTARPFDALSLSVEPTWGVEIDTDQFFARRTDAAATETFGQRYVFADLRQESVDLGVRLNLTVTPELTLQLYARPFVLAGQYSNLKEFRAPGSFDFDVYGEDRGSVQPQVFTEQDLNDNGLLDDYEPAPPGTQPDRFFIDPGNGGEAFAVGNSDFNFRSLRGNAVLRWEWRPGSTLFFVWQQRRTDDVRYEGFDVFDELDKAFRAPVENVFLIKATYWLGL